MKRNIITVLIAVVASGLTAWAVVEASGSGRQDLSQTALSPDGSQYRTVNLSLEDYPDFTFAAESAVDAVVYVEVTATQSVRTAPNSLFDFFFGDGLPQSRESRSSGSGVIIRQDGYIVTNNHVIDGATKVSVTLNNNKTYDATVIGTDPTTDVGLIKIDAQGLPVIPFGDSDKLRLGEWVLAIGSPYGLRSTITAGIVSAKGRSMPPQNPGEMKIESFIQTDAAVNPGNSGGALVDKSGHLVGVNTAIFSQTGSYAGYSFAIPVNMVKKIVDDLIDFGSVKRALLGITMTDINQKIADELKLSSLNGVYITEVLKGSAADNAGIREKDILVAIDSTKITNAASVQEKVSTYRPGDKAVVTVVRNGRTLNLDVEFKGTAQETGTVDKDGAVAFYGAKIRQASKETLQQLGLKKGVEIFSIGSGKIMDAGVEDGFVIQYVNDQPVATPQDVINVIKKSKRAVFIEGVTPAGRSSYFGFGL